MSIALIGLRRADPNIPWPARGSGGRELEEREGWTRMQIPAAARGNPVMIDANVFRGLAVNVMLEGEGFAIALAFSGCRISYDGAVFARCQDAMAAAEDMLGVCLSWDNVAIDGFTDAQRGWLKRIVEGAKARGEILIDPVFPS